MMLYQELHKSKDNKTQTILSPISMCGIYINRYINGSLIGKKSKHLLRLQDYGSVAIANETVFNKVQTTKRNYCYTLFEQ